MELSAEFTLPGTDLEVMVEFDYTPYDSGRTSGPPEDCYPPEGGEAELTAVYMQDDDILHCLNTQTIKILTDQAETWAREAQSRGDL